MSSFSAPHSLYPVVPAAPSSHPRNDQVSNEDLSKESAISREELVSEEEIVIESIRRPKNQMLELLHSVAQEDSFRNAALQLEEMTELTPRAGRSQRRGRKAGKALSRKKQRLDASLGEINGVRKRKESAGATRIKATTSEEKLAKLGHKIRKNLDKTVKETMNSLKSLFPGAYEVMRP